MKTALLAMALLGIGGAALARVDERGSDAAASYFEDFEAYRFPGPLPESAGWRVDNSRSFTVIKAHDGAIADGRSVRHDEGYETSGSWDVETPVFGPGFGVFRVLVGFGEQNTWYQLGLADPTTTFFVAWIEFEENLRVGQAEVGLAGFRVIDTGVPTPANAIAELAFEVRPSGLLRVRLDGAIIHEGVETHRALFGRTGRMGQLHIKLTGGSITFDNLRFDPLALPADLDEDGMVGTKDLGTLIGAWGPCAPGVVCDGDVNGDGLVDSRDLAELLGQWGG